MTWLYWAYFILLAGAELNAELTKERHPSRISAKQNRPEKSIPDRAA
jgi:uncharacterized BrkB/YihY/UPF0761 family membrane protein